MSLIGSDVIWAEFGAKFAQVYVDLAIRTSGGRMSYYKTPEAQVIRDSTTLVTIAIPRGYAIKLLDAPFDEGLEAVSLPVDLRDQESAVCAFMDMANHLVVLSLMGGGTVAHVGYLCRKLWFQFPRQATVNQDVHSDGGEPCWSMTAPTESGFYLVKSVSRGVVAVAEVFIGPAGDCCYYAGRQQSPKLFASGVVGDSEGVFVWSKRIKESALATV